jgi:ribosomal protein L21
LKQYDIQKKEIEIYRRQVDTLQAQVVLLDSVVTMATAHIQTLDSVIVESESVVDTLHIANKKYEEKIHRMKKWYNIKTGFLLGLIILTTIL